MCNPTERFNHNYINGTCLDCGRSQKPVHKVEVKHNLFANLCNRKKESPNSKHQLANDCVADLGGNFLFYMKVISTVGEQTVREWLSSAKQAPVKYSKVAIFVSTYKKFMDGVIWKKV